jgi:CDP-6-deoxy-D-xylo-4-hexulose-3-dehydrase
MNYKIPLVKESFYLEKITKKEVIKFVKESNKFSMGNKTKSFEEKFAHFQQSKYCVYFSSGSAANLALIQALKNLNLLENDDLVAVSSLTWATNVMPLIQLNLKPIAIDIDLETLNISLKDLEKQYKNKKFKAIFLTNALSFSCDMKKLVEFCTKNNVILIEDNCESLGSEFNYKKLGNFGLAGTMSFFIGHQMSTIEGGCVVTDNEELYEMLKTVRAHGWNRDNKNFNDQDFYSRFTFQDLAYNLRPGEINAVIGLKQLELLSRNLKNRFKIYKKFKKIIKNKQSIYNLKTKNNFYAPFAFTLVFKEKKDTENFINLFKNEGIEIRPVISGNITKQPFFKKYILENFELPNCDIVHNNGFYFGVNPNLNKEEIEYICRILEKIN